MPKTGTVAVYELPEAFVNADPHETKRILLEVARMAETRAAEYPGYSVRVLSYSASNGI